MDSQALCYGTALVILWLILAFMAIKCRTQPAISSVPVNAVSTQTIETMRDMLRQRVAYVKNREGLLTPVNKSVLQKVETLIPNAGINNITAILELLPGNRLGFLPLEPICDPNNGLLLQLEQ